jgi:Ca2+-binding RTX toxin-like protein
MPIFKISTEFSSDEAKAILASIDTIFNGSGSNVQTFLAGLPAGPFYITKKAGANAAYTGLKNLSAAAFYDIDANGDPYIPQNAAGPTVGESVFIGDVYVQNAANGFAIGTKASPSGTFQTSLSRTIFHELAHAVTIPDFRNVSAFGGDGTAYAGVEALAIAAEDLIYAKDRHLPSRIGHNPNFIAPSFDPALPFRNVANVYYQTINRPGSGISGVYFGADIDGGTIEKAYGHTGSILNNVTITGTKSSGVITDVGGLSQTFRDSLAGMLGSQAQVRADISASSANLKTISTAEQALAQNQALVSATPGLAAWANFQLSSLTNVTGFSNERFTDGNYAAGKIVNYVGPVDAGSGKPNLNLQAAAPSIVIGAAGFYDGGKGIDFRQVGETLQAADGGPNILMAGSSQGTSVTHTLIGGSGNDVLIGGAGNDVIQATAGDDLVIQSAGQDTVSGDGSTIFALSTTASRQTVDTRPNARGQTAVSDGNTADGTTLLTGTHIFVGNSQLTTFIGNTSAADVFIAGSGGGDFTLESGDVAIGNSNARGGNIYRVSTTDIQNGHVGIVGFGKNDKLYVDGKLFTGSSITAKITGNSYDSNGDFYEGSGVRFTGKSSWGFMAPTSTLSTGKRPGGLTYHYWNQNYGNETFAGYVKSSDSTAENESGDIIFTSGQALGLSGVLSMGTSPLGFDISITGWSQGYGGIDFSENNLARDLLTGEAAYTGVFAYGLAADGTNRYYLKGNLNAPIGASAFGDLVTVGSSFGANAADWQTNTMSGYTTGNAIANLIAAALGEPNGGSTGDPGGGGGPGLPPGFPGGPGGGIFDVPGDNDGDGNVTLDGDDSANVLDPQGAYSVVVGHGGGDTIVYGTGYGPVSVVEDDAGASPTNQLSFQAGITADQVSVAGTDAGDIVLSLGGSDQLTLVGALRSTSNLAKGVQAVSFPDGTTWTYADLLAKISTATSVGGVIYGDSSANLLDTAGLASAANGGGGGDTFIFNAGYGSVTINETDAPGGTPNVLSIGYGLDWFQAHVSGQDDGSILIDFGTGDSITITRALLSTPEVENGVQQVQFADGTTWSYGDLLTMVETDTSQNPNATIYGDQTANVLSAGGDVTKMVGNGGGDTFVFAGGDQPVTLLETDTSTTPANVLDLQGFSADEITVRANAQGDVLLLAEGVVQVTIAGALNGSDGSAMGVQSVVFDDGTTWSYADLLAKADTASPDNTTLYGDANANSFDPAGFATSVVGGGGGDTIVYNRGYGALSITEEDTSPTASNALAFGSGISAADVAVTGDDAGDLIVSLGGGDVITLVGALLGSPGDLTGVQSVTFSDGTSWTYADLLQKALTPTQAEQTLYGDTGANVIDSGGIAATVVGNGGGDTFIYNRGYGALTIDDSEQNLTSRDALAFGSSISPADVTVSATMGGALVLSLGGGDVVTLAGALNSDEGITYGVELVTFADGTSWTYEDMLAKVSTASQGGASTIFGDASSNTLDPSGSASTVVGGGGDDTILYNRGYGVVTVDERDIASQPDNVLQFGSGIDPADVSVFANAAGDIILDAGSGDEVTLAKALNSGDALTYGVQEVRFADGSTWSYDDLIAKADTPSTTNTALYGDAGPNVLDGIGIAGLLVGGGGGDTFVFNQGDGALTIDEQDSGGAPDNKLLLGSGIEPANVTVSANASGDLILNLGGSDQVTLRSALNGGNGTIFGVQEIAFADGTTWTYDDLVASADTGSASNQTLYGDSYANTFDSAGLAHKIIGRGGGDVITYNRGYGALSIDEEDSGVDPRNVLAFGPDIAPGDVTVSTALSGDIELSLGSGDVVTLLGVANSTTTAMKGVQQVTFADGLIWSAAQLQALASGSWSIADDGQQTDVDEAVNVGALTPVLSLDFSSSNVTVELGADRNSLTITSTSGTSVQINDLLRQGAGVDQSIHFNDGVTWTLDYAASRATNISNVANYEIGTASAEDLSFAGGVKYILGGGGADSIRYEAGEGSVELSESDTTGTASSLLHLGAGITPSSLAVTSNGQDLNLTFPNGDGIQLTNALLSDSNTAYGVKSVDFDDGTSLDYQQLLQIADTGTATNSGTLYGDANANIIDPGGYSHAVMGGGGSDTIIYNQGYGDLDIKDYQQSVGSNATIAFGAGIDASDIDIEGGSSDFYNTRAVTITVAGAEISIDNELSNSTPSISGLTFADGTMLTYADMLSAMEAPTAGKTQISGDFGANTLDTQGLVHQVVGDGGGDTFVYNRGYGALNIVEHDDSQTPSNRLLFGTGIDPDDVSVSTTQHGKYQLDLGNGDLITFYAGQEYSNDGVQSVQFADGTDWSLSDLLSKADTGTPTKVSISGLDLNETFDSAGYARYINGGTGSDTYLFNRGYGALTVSDISQYGADANVLSFGADIHPEDIVVSKDGQDVILSIGASDRVLLSNQLWAPYGNQFGVEQVIFADGTVWSASVLQAMASVTPSGSAATVEPASNLQAGITLPVSADALLSAAGAIAFEDADAGDSHAVSVVGVSYTDSSYPNLPSTAQMLNYLSASVTGEPSGSGEGSIAWTFTAPSSAFDVLSPGETVNLHFTLQIQDQNHTVTSQDLVVSVTAGIDGNPATVRSSGTSGDDTLYLDRNFEVDPGTGNDTLYASAWGGGTIQFAKGDGNDNLYDNSWYGNRTDNLKMTDVNPDEVSLNQSGYTLTVQVDSTGDSFTADDQFIGGNMGLNQIDFADGTVWDRTEIINRVAGTAYAMDIPDQVYDASDDVDTFDLNGGMGHATITDFDTDDPQHDYVEVNRNQFSDWAHLLGATRQQGSDLVISLDNSNSVVLAGVSLANFTSKDVKFAGLPS